MYKMLLVSNMYPNEDYPEYGIFVKNFYDQMKETFFIEKSILKKKKRFTKIQKVKSYLEFYLDTMLKLLHNEYEIVYIHYISHSSLIILLFKKKYKIVTNIHGSDIRPKGKFKKIYQFIARKILEKSDLIVVPTNYYKYETLKFYDINSEKIFVSPSGGINQSIFKAHSKDTKNQEFTLGFAGRIVSEKGWKTLIEAIVNLKDEQIVLKIVGNGKEEKKLVETIKQYNLSDIVFFDNAKTQEELAQFYSEIDCLVFPSEQESLGLVGLEAMSSECLLIGSNIPAISSYLLDDYNGYTFEMGNANSLSNTIRKVMNLSEQEKLRLLKHAKLTAKNYNSELVSSILKTKIKDLMIC